MSNQYESIVRALLQRNDIQSRLSMGTDVPVWHVNDDNVGKVLSDKDLSKGMRPGVFVLDLGKYLSYMFFGPIHPNVYSSEELPKDRFPDINTTYGGIFLNSDLEMQFPVIFVVDTKFVTGSMLNMSALGIGERGGFPPDDVNKVSGLGNVLAGFVGVKARPDFTISEQTH